MVNFALTRAGLCKTLSGFAKALQYTPQQGHSPPPQTTTLSDVDERSPSNYEAFTNAIRSIKKYTGSSVTTKQVMQLHDYCLCLLASRRQSIDISSQEDHFFRPSKMRPIPSNFPHVSVTSLKRADLIFSRHLADALSVIPTLDALATKLNKTNQPLAIVDVGSGGGLPGIVIAIMRPHYSVTAVDTVGKKCEFMNVVAKRIGLTNFVAVKGNAESLTQSTEKESRFVGGATSRQPSQDSITFSNSLYRETFDIAISRGLAPLPLLAELCLGFVRVGGYMLCQKSIIGKSYVNEKHDNQHSSPTPAGEFPTFSLKDRSFEALLRQPYSPVPTKGLRFDSNIFTPDTVDKFSSELSSTLSKQAVENMGGSYPWEYVFCEDFFKTKEHQELANNSDETKTPSRSVEEIFDSFCGREKRQGRIVKGDHFVYRLLLSMEKSKPTPKHLPRMTNDGLGTSFLASTFEESKTPNTPTSDDEFVTSMTDPQVVPSSEDDLYTAFEKSLQNIK